MEIVIRKTPEQVSLQAADILEPYVSEGATLGLATGSTPLGTYQELIRRHNESGLSFANNQAFLLDEYVGLPRDHEQSYYRTIRREFTEHIDIKDEAVSSPDGLADNIDEAGRAYDERIRNAGGVDIQILGIGTDGHIGFNEPCRGARGRQRESHRKSAERRRDAVRLAAYWGCTAFAVHPLSPVIWRAPVTWGFATVGHVRKLSRWCNRGT